MVKIHKINSEDVDFRGSEYILHFTKTNLRIKVKICEHKNCYCDIFMLLHKPEHVNLFQKRSEKVKCKMYIDFCSDFIANFTLRASISLNSLLLRMAVRNSSFVTFPSALCTHTKQGVWHQILKVKKVFICPFLL